MDFGFPRLRNFRSAIIVAGLVIALPAVAFAQADPKGDPRVVPPKDSKKKLPEAPAKLPKIGADRTKGLDFLFGALKAAPNEESAKHVEARIWALWTQTSSDTTALLMQRSKAAMDNKQVDVALKLLNAVVKLKPDYVEGWNR